MDPQTAVDNYIQDITPHRKRARNVIFLLTILQLIAVLIFPISAFRYHFEALVIVSCIGIVAQALYWGVFAPRIKTGWGILLYSSPFAITLGATAYLSGGLLVAGALALIVTTIVVYKSIQLILLTLIQIVVINALFLVDAYGKGVSHEWMISTFILELAIATTGLIAAVTSFEIQEREQRMVHLAEIDQIKTTFIAIVSHNLRTPISVIAGYLEILEQKRSGLDQEVVKIVDNLTQSARGLASLIEDTIRISAYQTGEIQLNFTKLHVKTLIVSVLEGSFRQQAATKGLHLSYAGSPDNSDSTVYIEGDSEQLKVMLSEVIDNAIKFTDKGSVTLTVQQQGPDITLQVTDTGKGIPEEFQKLMFSQFSRPGNILQYDKRGLGLGLYITKLIVEAHRGKIWFDSKLNMGTTVFIRLPKNHTIPIVNKK